MGLEKVKTAGTQHVSNYWKIISTSVPNRDSGRAAFAVGLYKDKAAADADADPVEVKHYSCPPESNPVTLDAQQTNDVHALCYIRLKVVDPYFSDATDIFEPGQN